MIARTNKNETGLNGGVAAKERQGVYSSLCSLRSFAANEFSRRSAILTCQCAEVADPVANCAFRYRVPERPRLAARADPSGNVCDQIAGLVAVGLHDDRRALVDADEFE